MLAVQADEQTREIHAPDQAAERRHHHVFDERSDDSSERRADDDTDRHIEDVSAHGKIFELFQHDAIPFVHPMDASTPGLTTSYLMMRAVRSADYSRSERKKRERRNETLSMSETRVKLR